MALRKLFPTLIWQRSLSVERNELKRLRDECYAFRAMDEEGQAWSHRHYPAGYTSYSSIADLHRRSGQFDRIRKLLDREVGRYARALDLDLGGRKLKINSFWINIMGQLAHHSFHLHPLSAISGTFYLQTPKDSPGLKLEDPRIAGFMGSPPRLQKAKLDNHRYIELSCQAGEVILFESWLKHEVPANRSVNDRVSVSFNYGWE